MFFVSYLFYKGFLTLDTAIARWEREQPDAMSLPYAVTSLLETPLYSKRASAMQNMFLELLVLTCS